MSFHQCDCLRHLRGGYAQAMRQIHPLISPRLTQRAMDELIRDQGGECRSVLLANQLQHHIQGSNATGAGADIAIEDEEIAADIKLGKSFAKGGQVIPMQGEAAVLQQAGAGQNEAGGADAADQAASAMGTTQGIGQGSVAITLAAEATT